MVFTARYVASRPGIDIDAVEKLAEQMRPEDGCVSVIDSLAETAESIAAVTRHGLDYLGRAARRASLRVHEGRLRPPWPSPDGYLLKTSFYSSQRSFFHSLRTGP